VYAVSAVPDRTGASFHTRPQPQPASALTWAAVSARILALLVAVAMVAGAVVLRSHRDERKALGAHPLRLACAADFADFCNDLGSREGVSVKVEPADATADRMAGAPDPNLDGWLTAAPWPAMADQRRVAASLPRAFASDSPEVLARSPVVLAVWPDRAAALRQFCPGGGITWKCLGQAARLQTWAQVKGGRPEWGTVKAFTARADALDGAGMVVLAAATSNYFNNRVDLSSAELDNPDYQDWLGALAQARPDPVPDFSRLLAQGASAADAYGTVEAVAAPALASSGRSDKPALIYPAPMMTADVVVATVPGSRGDRLGQVVRDAVRREFPGDGWRVPGKSGGAGRAPTTPALPASNGLPDPGFLDALRGAWKAAQ
jgi:hypothetical protein